MTAPASSCVAEALNFVGFRWLTPHGWQGGYCKTQNVVFANPDLFGMAEGRDAAATLDSNLSGSSGFQNDGDNEITGMHVSDGDPTVSGLVGTRLTEMMLQKGYRFSHLGRNEKSGGVPSFVWDVEKAQLA